MNEQKTRTALALFIICTAISALSLLIGSTFRTMHWPGSSLFLIVGFTLMIVSYFLYTYWKKLQAQKKGEEVKSLSIVYIIGAVFVLAGIFFRIMHWQYSNILLFTGLAAALIDFLISVFKSKQ